MAMLMAWSWRTLSLLILAACPWPGSPAHAAEALPPEFFENSVRPLLLAKCGECHGEKQAKGGLRVDTREAFFKGGEAGAIVVPGQPDQSPFIKAIRFNDPDLAMPPKRKLADFEIDLLTRWVAQGAPWPQTPASAKAAVAGITSHRRPPAELWSLRPLADRPPPEVPAAQPPAWAVSTIDRHILASLAQRGLSPSPRADPRTLIRRASFDLIGLPPSYEEVEAFAAQASDPAAYPALIDRLLASPRYGERWGRHWLDVARYADTKGYVGDTADNRYPFGYSYRDYVVAAFNEDKPYDRFIHEQLAADALGLPPHDPALAALGFLTIGRRFIGANNHDEVIDDRIDVATRGLMGLAVQCARCHDHPYDPISSADYYALYGVFRSTEEPELPVRIGPEPQTPGYKAYSEELDKRRKAITDYKASLGGRRPNQGETNHIRKLESKVNEWVIASPDAPPHAMVVRDDDRMFEPYVFLRGKPHARGPSVPRRFLSLLAPFVGDKPFNPKTSGRLDLAQHIAHPNNPYTSRAIVNRIWMHHFGEGLFRSPSDQGFRGQEPSHPELLDHLALSFVQRGWSIKKLHREIMLSETYQQSSRFRPDAWAIDPENRLLWRMNRRRLEIEPLRDALLASSGRLDLRLGGKSVPLFDPKAQRRSVYGWFDRQDLAPELRYFDFASPDASVDQRPRTTVPQQALFMLNGGFVHQQARGVLDRMKGSGDDATAARRAFQLVLARDPDPTEHAWALEFLKAEQATGPGRERLVKALMLSNEFAFVD